MPSDEVGSSRDAVLRYVERFAIALVGIGMARMPARIFAYVLVDDATRHSVGELAEAIRVSPAAASVAVRDLVQAGLLRREREPGDRSDTYVISSDDFWAEIYGQRLPILHRFQELAAEGVALLDGGPGSRRLAETESFFAFLAREFPAMFERWRAERRQASAP